MRKIFLILLLLTINLQTQWIKQAVPSDIVTLLSVHFFDQNIGVASGTNDFPIGKAIYTTNSGINWVVAQLPDSARSMVKIQMMNSTTGYIAGACNTFFSGVSFNQNESSKSYHVMPDAVRRHLFRIGMVSSGEGYKGMFLKTTNGGTTWSTHGTLAADVYYLLGMKFINLDTGFVLASFNYSGGVKCGVLRSTNGGSTWSTLLTMDTVDFNNIYTSDGISIYVAGAKIVQNQNYGIIISTSNSGINWITQNFVNTTQFMDINFTNESTGFAVTWDLNPNAMIFKTTNAGANWIKLGFESNNAIFHGVEFVNGTGKGIVVGAKLISPLGIPIICRTIDYGSNWTQFTSNDTNNFAYSQSLIDQNNWFVCGYRRIIYKSSNGGEIAIAPICGEIPEKFNLSQNYPNPFNPDTKIRFEIPVSASNGDSRRLVQVKIYNILGSELETLINDYLLPGIYQTRWSAADYPSGVYYYRLITGDFSATKKMILVK